MIKTTEFVATVQKWSSVAKFAESLQMNSDAKHKLIDFSGLSEVCDLVRTLAVENIGDSFRLSTCDPFGVAEGFSINDVKNAALREGKKAKSHWVRCGHTWVADIVS